MTWLAKSAWPYYLVEMNGVLCGSRPMRISLAIPRKQGTMGGFTVPPAGAQTGAGGDEDPANCTVFVGGRVDNCHEDFQARYHTRQRCLSMRSAHLPNRDVCQYQYGQLSYQQRRLALRSAYQYDTSVYMVRRPNTCIRCCNPLIRVGPGAVGGGPACVL